MSEHTVGVRYDANVTAHRVTVGGTEVGYLEHEYTPDGLRTGRWHGVRTHADGTTDAGTFDEQAHALLFVTHGQPVAFFRRDRTDADGNAVVEARTGARLRGIAFGTLWDRVTVTPHGDGDGGTYDLAGNGPNGSWTDWVLGPLDRARDRAWDLMMARNG